MALGAGVSVSTGVGVFVVVAVFVEVGSIVEVASGVFVAGLAVSAALVGVNVAFRGVAVILTAIVVLAAV